MSFREIDTIYNKIENMNKCLNCGKEVTNKYCGTACQNKHRGKLLLEEYNKSPKKCIECDSIIEYDNRRNDFCCSSCSTKYNNRGNNYNLILSKLSDSDIIDLFNKSNSYKEFYISLGYTGNPIPDSLKRIKIKLNELGLDIRDINKNRITERTKISLFNERLNWQSARSSIAKDSRITYNKSDKPKCCYVCGYDKHIEIAHIKSVSSFDDNTLISEINHIDNLIALCPNHHWEFDNGLLKF